MRHGLILALLGPTGLLIAFLISERLFLSLFLSGTYEILELGFAYNAILFGGIATIWIMVIASSIFLDLGDMQHPTRMMIIGNLIQILLSNALVLSYSDAPKLGIFGAAVSVNTTTAVACGHPPALREC